MKEYYTFIRNIIIVAFFLYALSFIPIIQDFVRFSSAPIIRPVRHLGESVRNSIQVIFSIGTLAKDNGRLRAEVNELSSVSIQNAELKHENELLKQELQLAPQTGGSLIAAQVISRSSSVSQQSILINKGSDDGFKDGMAVVVQGYFIGRASEILPRTSRIVLITSAESLLPIVTQKSRSVGLLRGGIQGLMVDEIPRDISVESGEAIVTSNIGDVVPAGLPVGKVETVASATSDVFQTARITSPIDFGRLEIVFGVK
jgi:rod shape-determining protein MreC